MGHARLAAGMAALILSLALGSRSGFAQGCDTLDPSACPSNPECCLNMIFGRCQAPGGGWVRSGGFCGCSAGSQLTGQEQPPCEQCAPGTWSPGGLELCAPCAADTFSSGSGSTSCTPCPTNTTTNGQTGQTQCAPTAVPAGFYMNSATGAVVPCPADTFAATARPASEATSCPACGTGLSTNQQTGQQSCGFVRPGYFSSNGATAQPCAANTFSASMRVITSAATCTTCATGSSTNAALGQSACSWALPGYRFSNGVPTACSVNTFAAGVRTGSSATSCSACAPGRGTLSRTAQSACNGVLAGWYYPGVTRQCPAGTYSRVERVFTTAFTCTRCPIGTTSGTGATSCRSIFGRKAL